MSTSQRRMIHLPSCKCDGEAECDLNPGKNKSHEGYMYSWYLHGAYIVLHDAYMCLGGTYMCLHGTYMVPTCAYMVPR